MKFKDHREYLCEIGHRIWQQGLSPGTGGNISIRVSKNKILISPTLTSMGFIQPKELCYIDLNGKILSCRSKPSSEFKLHLMVYNSRPEINAVIHAHPPFASAFAVTGKHLSTFIQPETFVFLGKIPLVQYGTPSTDELPENLKKYLISGLNSFLLQNHGVLCIETDLERTYFNLETLENLAKITVISRLIGSEQEISKVKLMELKKMFNVKIQL
jgi:L-fuculose-phosphate aldolase